MAETQKERIMRILNVSAEEADKIIADDKAIDRGERMEFDLSKEEEKKAMKLANAGTRKTKKTTNFNFDTSTKKRKENPTKASIIQMLAESLKEYENVEITNKERQISFSVGEDNFELTLVQKRKPKK